MTPSITPEEQLDRLTQERDELEKLLRLKRDSIRELVIYLVKVRHGNQVHIARKLGINREQIRLWLRQHEADEAEAERVRLRRLRRPLDE